MRCFGGKYYNYLIDFAHSCLTETVTKLMLRNLHESLKAATKQETELIKIRDTYYLDIAQARDIADRCLKEL